MVLKDGTFQIVREYQMEGDRVRYYSVERSEWEELPAALVDWDATKKSEADDAARDQELTKKIKATELAARTADLDSDRSYEARPGILLPDNAGLYAVDGKAVVTMEQNEAVSHLDKGRVRRTHGYRGALDPDESAHRNSGQTREDPAALARIRNFIFALRTAASPRFP